MGEIKNINKYKREKDKKEIEYLDELYEKSDVDGEELAIYEQLKKS